MISRTSLSIALLIALCTGCIVIFSGCGSEPEKKAGTKPDAYPLISAQAGKDLNISILVDLSDRINPMLDNREPAQADRDISIVNVLVNALKKNISAHGSFQSKARINVYFHPEPSDPQIREIAKKLSVAWVKSNEPEKARENKLRYQQLDSNFANGLRGIYTLAAQAGSYPGSDIWRFMQDEVKMKCIETDTGYRNILVILTDGYMYYKQGRMQQPGTNHFNYIERGVEHFSRFRDASLMAKEFDVKGYGLIPATHGLDNLEVLVLECRPEDKYPQDFDIMQKYWCPWLKAMGVKHAEIYKSQQPAYHEKIIAGFLKQNTGVCQ